MRANQVTGVWGRATVAAGLGVALLTVGCGGVQGTTLRSAAVPAADQAGVPVVVSCEPGQRTVVRPAVVNGAAISQVACVSIAPASPLAYAPAAPVQTVPVSYREVAPRVVSSPVFDGAGVIPVAATTVARPVAARQVMDDDDRPTRVVTRPRSVKKSAIIIGSSAGAGAGIGAAVGGKKGALLGAVIGGGGAALWDQVTRRK